jgi:hypothetical protein
LLLNGLDSTLVKGASSDATGHFQFEQVAAGKYRLKISYLGFDKISSPTFSYPGPEQVYEAGTFTLQANAKTLKGVEVVAEKQFIERQLDKLVINVDKSIVSAGTTALELLKRLPGVSVNQQDAISLMNKPGVLVLINGRPSHLGPAELATLLKSLNTDQIEKIEIMVNPPAKYDAAGSAGVINIVLKKNQALGLNSSVHAGGLVSNEAVFGRMNHTGDAGINLNYRIPKWNFFGSYDYSSEQGGWGADITNRFYANGVLQSMLTQHIINNSSSDSQFGKLGVDYELSPRVSMGFLANAQYIYGTANNDLNTNVLTDASGNTLSSTNAYFNVHEPIQSGDANLYYDFKIDTTGRELSVNADYLSYYNPNQHNLFYYNYDASGNFISPLQHTRSYQINNIQVASIKADYTHPIGKKIRIDGGLKSAQVTSDNDGTYLNYNGSQSYVDHNLTNHFIYTENIYAGYLNYKQELSTKWSIQAGLRGEQSQVKGQLYPRDTVFTHSYFNLFPTVFLNYKLNEKNTFNFSYSKRIDRPDYSSVNPFQYARGPYTFSGGNASLRPQYTNGVELSHAYKGLLISTIGYSQTTDATINSVRQNDVTHITYVAPINLGKRISSYLTVALALPITKWFTTTTSLTGYYVVDQGVYLGQNFNRQATATVLNTQNTVKLSSHFRAELSFVTITKVNDGITTQYPMYFLDAGLQMNFASDRGTIKLNGGDLLWNHSRNDVQYQNMNITDIRFGAGPFLHLGFTWKLGSSTTNHEAKARGGTEELRRVK